MPSDPIVSVVIPCYNSGEYIREAIESVEQYPDSSIYEIIIVNDGSTSEETLRILNELKGEGYQVMDQPNQGPAAARNKGIQAAKGKYILLLDSDNKILFQYINHGINILNNYPKVGVVYGNATFFGKDTLEQRFSSAKFDLALLLLGNYIDNCAVIRKSMWEEVGGLDTNRVLIGHEDWDFWIRSSAKGWDFYYVNEVLFQYRIREDSLIKQASLPDKFKQMHQYVYSKNSDIIVQVNKNLYYKCHQLIAERVIFKKNPLIFLFKKLVNKIRN